MKQAAQIISHIFHPVMIPTIITGCFYLLNADFFIPLERHVATAQVFLMTFLLPICIFYFLKSLGMLNSSIMITKVHERTVPMFLNIFIINILIFRVWSNLANSSLKKFFIAYCITYFILFCSTLLKRKYSVHVASFCCGIPLLINQTTSYYLNPFIFLPCLLIILGLIASARLYLKAHTNMEIIMGAVIGFTPSFIVFFL